METFLSVVEDQDIAGWRLGGNNAGVLGHISAQVDYRYNRWQ